MRDSNALRQSIIDGCLWMQTSGLNQGTSGNISLRVGDGMLITPSAVAYDKMTPDMIVHMPLDTSPTADQNPSTEWPFHQAALKARPDMTLSDMVAAALQSRHGCLMANHGALALGETLDKALWRMQELETLARVMLLSETSGTPVLLSDDEIAETLTAFQDYGLKVTND